MSIDTEVEQTEMSEIDKKIVALPKEKQREFYERLNSVSNNKYWFEKVFGPSWRRFYSDINVHILEVKETLYREEFAPKPEQK